MSRKGLGLDLYICQELVTAHGGRIWVESQVGQASTLFFTLPVFSLAGLLSPLLSSSAKRSHALMLITIGVSFLSRSLPTLTLDTLLRQV